MQQDKKEWLPKGNVGLHNYLAAEDYNGHGKYFKKQATYQPKPLNEKEVLYKNTSEEIIAKIKKIYIQHWIFKGIKEEFRTKSINRWDPHPINITDIKNVKSIYKVLAESVRGPQVAEHNNCISVQFEICPKYPETIQIIKNFISRKLLEIQVYYKNI